MVLVSIPHPTLVQSIQSFRFGSFSNEQVAFGVEKDHQQSANVNSVGHFFLKFIITNTDPSGRAV
jgi:hypothetical protein